MAASAPARPFFDPVDTAAHPAHAGPQDDVESPSLSSSNALARFEFEPGRSREGTKVLMVEWEDDDTTRNVAGDWEISWDEKTTVLPARDAAPAKQQPAPQNAPVDDALAATPSVNRLYFLLGPGVAVPPAVYLQKGPISWRTNPLPAIFPPELGATARQAGKKGVLHTIWAKKRLQVLQNEIAQELEDNVEGIGLQMAIAEREWIEQNFGVSARPTGLSISVATPSSASLNSPTSPRTPGGGRLMDKFKGLKLGTSERELHGGSSDGTASGSGSGTPSHPPGGPAFNPLSPEMSDVAVGSFGSFAALKGVAPPSTLAAKPPQPPSASSNATAAQATSAQRKFVAQRPPENVSAAQSGLGMGSLNALAASSNFGSLRDSPTIPEPASAHDSILSPPDHDSAGDLFALPMSPRSPEMAKSPFSFAPHDTSRYLQGERT